MAIAAIYARGVGDEEKSVTRQIEHAKAYAATKGWAVAEDYIYVDDGISGAEFVKRPGFIRLMNALKPKPTFQILIMSEESRLGREQIETAYALKQSITAGVRVFYFLENRERTLESPTDKLSSRSPPSPTRWSVRRHASGRMTRSHGRLARDTWQVGQSTATTTWRSPCPIRRPGSRDGSTSNGESTKQRRRSIARSSRRRRPAGYAPNRARPECPRGPSSSPATSRTATRLGALDHLRHAHRVPLPR